MSTSNLAALIARCRTLGLGSQASDAELLRRFARQRDSAAFAELVERYAPLVWGVCRRINPIEADCEDAFQATFAALVRQADRLDPTRPLGAWLHTVAAHTSRKAQARSLRQRTQALPPDPSTPRDVADEVSSRELLRAVDEEIERLPNVLRMPVILCCLEGRTRDEAAEALGCSLAAVKSRLERGRNCLRQRLQRRGIELPAAFLVLSLTTENARAALRSRAIAVASGSLTPTVAALVPTFAVSGTSKLALVALTLLTASVLAWSAMRFTQSDPLLREDAPDATSRPASVEKAAPVADDLGDPLPPGAIRRFGTVRFRQPNLMDIAFSSDGKELIASAWNSPVIVFDALSGRRLRELGKSSMGWGRFALSPDGKQIAYCGSKNEVLELQSGRLIREFACERSQGVVFSLDGTKVAAIKQTQDRGEESQTSVVVFALASGKQLAEGVVGKGAPMRFFFRDLAFSPDGNFLAGRYGDLRQERPFVHEIVSSDVRLFDAKTGKPVHTFQLAKGIVVAFAFQPGTGHLVTYGKDGVLRFWDAPTGKEVRHFPVAKGPEGNQFGVLCFSADGRRCAFSTNQAKYLVVLDTREGRILRRIQGEESRMKVALTLSPDGKSMAAARLYDESCLRVWDVKFGVERLVNVGHRVAATSLTLSADGRKLISQDSKGQEIHWDLQSGRQEVRATVSREQGGQFVWSQPFSERALRGPRWRLVHKNQEPAIMEVWSLDGARLIRKAEGPTSILTTAVSPDGTHLALTTFGGPTSTVLLWDPERQETPRKLQDLPGDCAQLLFTHDGKRFITGTRRYDGQVGALWIWDTTTARVVRKLETRSDPGHLLLSADDRVLFAGGERDAAVYAWDTETGEQLAQLTNPSLKLVREENNPNSPRVHTCLALSANERLLAVSSTWGGTVTLNIWETGSWKLVRAFSPLRSPNEVQAMVFSHDGRSLFVANSDSTILEWDVADRYSRKSETPTAERFHHLWQMLAETPDQAYPAVWEMLDHPAQSVRFLKDKLTPVKPGDEKRIRQWIGQLDADSFAEREQASRRLLALGEAAVPSLRQALKEGVSPEAKTRIERILAQQKHTLSPDLQRQLRALAVLEWSHLVEADKQLDLLARGDPSASLTRAARAAGQRRQSSSSR